MHYFFVSRIGMTVHFLALSYTASNIIMLWDACFVPWAWRTTIWSSVLVTYNLIGTTFWHDIFVDLFSIGSRRYWDGDSKCLDVLGYFWRGEREQNCFCKAVPDDVIIRYLEGIWYLNQDRFSVVRWKLCPPIFNQTPIIWHVVDRLQFGI